MKVLELFSGIGAVSAAVVGQHEVTCAIDINQMAMKVFQANFKCDVQIREITSLTDQQFADLDAELWWMSPPCQPYTRRGLQRDLGDSRTRALLRVIQGIETVRPPHIALENVVGFETSKTYQLLCKSLQKTGYHFEQRQICPTDFGIPNLRPRFFLAASLVQPPALRSPDIHQRKRICEFLQPEDVITRELSVLESDLKRYFHAINIVDPSSMNSRCFTSAYGRSNVRSGSYLKTDFGFRRFSPREIARLLGFSDDYVFPEELSTKQLWKLLGNAVCVPCVRHVISALEDCHSNSPTNS